MKSKAVSGIMLILLLIGMLISTFNIQTVEAEPLPVVSLNPVEYTAWVGESFMIDVYITDVTDLGAFEFKMWYNTTILDVLSISSTPITEVCEYWGPVDENGTFHWDGPPTINDTIGRVWIGTLFPWGQEFTGDGILVTIDFTATGVGSCTLNLSDTVLGDSLANPIDHMTLDGSVTVHTCISLNPLESTVLVGSSFTVDVYITDVTDMRGCAIMLGYNNTLLEAVRVYSTDTTDDATKWLPINATGHFNPDKHPVINNTRVYAPNCAYLWIFAWGFTSFTGSGAVFTVSFIATAVGNCTLDLFVKYGDTIYPDEVEVVDSLADPIDHEVVDGFVTVVQAPPPVGGKATPINIPMNMPETPTLWIWLTIIILLIIGIKCFGRWRRR